MTMMYWYGHAIGGWGYTLVAISMIVFWGAVIYGVVALIRRVGRGTPQTREPAQPPAPDRLLAERFARGDIGEDEYRRHLAALRDAGRAATGDPRPQAGQTSGVATPALDWLARGGREPQR